MPSSLSDLLAMSLPSARAPRVEPLDHWHFKSYRRLPAACPIGFRFADFEQDRDGGAGRVTTYALVSRIGGGDSRPEFVEVGWDGVALDLEAPQAWSARLETAAAAAWEAEAMRAEARAVRA